jgi:predicted TIM-barrel fold metal-dependent hydrolase
MAGFKAEDIKLVGKAAETRPGGWDPHARLADMDLDGVDAEVEFGGGPLATQNRELYLASFTAYNNWLADFCSAAPDRLLGVAYIPTWDVDQAIQEVEHAVRRGLRGIVIAPFAPTQMVGGLSLGTTRDPHRNYYDAEYAPFWERVVALDLPVHMHLGAREAKLIPEQFLPSMVMSKLSMAEPIAQFIFSGMFVRYPTLKLVSVESQVGWFAFLAEYMDHLWHKHRYWTGNTLPEPPSYYMDRNVYGTFLDDREGILNRHRPGGKNIMWSSDYPHSETSWPQSRAYIAKIMAGVPEAEQAAIVCGNAMALYRLGEP